MQAHSVILLFLDICVLNTSALVTKQRLFVRHGQFNGNSCREGDAVITSTNITTEIACIASCLENGCVDVFYFPETKMCQGCYTFYSNDLQPAVSSEMSMHYNPVLECPGSFVRYNTSCYIVTESQQTWDFAKNFCETLNAHLASIEDAEEYSFIGNYLESEVGLVDHRIFFGLTDSQVENTWLNVNGDVQSYLPWSPYQPSEIPGVSMDEDCAVIAMDTVLKTWNDLPCSETHIAVCEMELF